MKILKNYKYSLISIALFLFSLFLGSILLSRIAIIATLIVFICELYAVKIENDIYKIISKSHQEKKN